MFESVNTPKEARTDRRAPARFHIISLQGSGELNKDYILLKIIEGPANTFSLF